jgi:hypothetical protein
MKIHRNKNIRQLLRLLHRLKLDLSLTQVFIVSSTTLATLVLAHNIVKRTSQGRHDIQHNDTRHNDIQHRNTLHKRRST